MLIDRALYSSSVTEDTGELCALYLRLIPLNKKNISEFDKSLNIAYSIFHVSSQNVGPYANNFDMS